MKIHSKEQVTMDKALVERFQAYIDRTGEHKNAVLRWALDDWLTAEEEREEEREDQQEGLK